MPPASPSDPKSSTRPSPPPSPTSFLSVGEISRPGCRHARVRPPREAGGGVLLREGEAAISRSFDLQTITDECRTSPRSANK